MSRIILLATVASFLLNSPVRGQITTLTTAADCDRALVQVAASARMYLDVYAQVLALPDLTRELLAAQQRGVCVRVIIDRANAASSWSQVIKLAPSRIPVRGTPCDEPIRRSFLLADQKNGLVGTYIWKPKSSGTSLMVVNDANALAADFERMWSDRRYADMLAPFHPQTTSNIWSERNPSTDLWVGKLYRDYASNEVNADKQYKGQVLIIRGYIQDITRQNDIAGINFYVNDEDIDSGWVRCEFSEEYEGQITNLKPQQLVRVKGACVGKTSLWRVTLRDCTVMQGG